MNKLLELIEILLPLLAIIESNNNPNALGRAQDAGLLQIRPILVEDANRIIKEKKLKIKLFTLADRFDPVRSRQLARVVLSHYGMKLPENERTLNNLAMIWNRGYAGYRNTNHGYIAKLNRLRRLSNV